MAANLTGTGENTNKNLTNAKFNQQSFNMVEKNKHDSEKQMEAERHDHDPHGVAYPTTYMETLFHLVKGNLGSGMFAMGDAFKNAGLFLGLFLTVFLGFVSVYGNHILIKCSKELAKRKDISTIPTFPDTMEWAFESGPEIFQKHSRTIRFLVKLFILIAQIGYCSVYFVFISTTTQAILAHYGYEVNSYILMAIVLVPMVSTAMVRTLKYLVPFSMIATALTAVGVILTMYLAMQDLPSVMSRRAVGSWSTLPLYFGTALFCFEGIGLVLPLQSEMKRPERFASPLGVLNVGMCIIGGVLVWMGFIGYLKYGEDVKGSLTLNLPSDSVFPQVIKGTIALGLFFTYGLQLHVGATYLWPDLVEKYGPFKHPLLAEYGLRLVLSLITFVAAELVPHLSLFISLLGSIGSTALVLVFPCLCDIALHHGQKPGPNYIFDVFCILLAAFGFVTGVYSSVKDIIAAFITSNL